ncbi:hypothetical protein [Naumannella halotolerans]|uniref:Uncharacterized protein n=1 Tax=Naumannella halotolerans TaxID=993414 RepID=A0A4R7J1V9_9ACTN|nr:hypothetical protein [Naumannella halotolerans]TDT31100.1 hypothetical protein CLV29_2513 [Naumannella halotolerans]
MTEFVRVSDKTTGHHYSTTKQIAERSDHLTVLPDHPAVNNHGELLPPKFKTTPNKSGKAETPKSEPKDTPTPTKKD